MVRLAAISPALILLADAGYVQGWMQDAFYPVLLGILVIASLGVPIPEDIPLIAAGVLLKTHPGIASWTGTMIVALIGIMSGDLVLYTLGRWWGPGVVEHRFVRRLLTRQRFLKMSAKFHQHGIWMVFFGRFFLGIRAAMCLTAGATHYPYPRFFLADCAGAILSIPLFVVLGYLFAGMLPTLRAYMKGVQLIILVVIVVAVAGIVAYMWWRRRRAARSARAVTEDAASIRLPSGADANTRPGA